MSITVKLFYLILGGVIGTLARFGTSKVIHRFIPSDLPYGTMAVNLIGCFLIGYLAVVSEKKIHLAQVIRLFLMIGFCGSFTTFSTFMLDTAKLIQDGQTLKAFWNVIGSMALGFWCFRLGVLLGTQF